MRKSITAIAGLALMSGSAMAFDVMSFGFTDLAGDFDTGAMPAHALDMGDVFDGVFIGMAVSGGGFDTGGDFSRLVGPEGTAEFDSGFEAGGFGDVTITITTANFDGMTAKGVGDVEIIDADGDTFTATFEGTWFATGPFMFFNAVIDAASFSTELGDGNFDGPSGGEFEYSDFPILDGAFSLLLRPDNGGMGFDSSFGPRSTQADAVLVPAPGVLALAGMGMFAAAGRRRG
jgi:hypothetical protein